MNIQIYKYKNTQELLIYSFEYFQNSNIFQYTGFKISRRNDENDIWGHQWENFYSLKKEKELSDYEKLHDFDPSGWDYDPLQEGYDNILKKYNPLLNKISTGQRYLEGRFSAMTSQTGFLPKPEFTEEELLEKLKIAVAEQMNNAKVLI